jgi:hypothetical protein
MEIWITGYCAMENAIHSTWKSKNVNTGYMVRAPTFGNRKPYNRIPPRRRYAAAWGQPPYTQGGFFHTQKQNQTILTAA